MVKLKFGANLFTVQNNDDKNSAATKRQQTHFEQTNKQTKTNQKVVHYKCTIHYLIEKCNEDIVIVF